MKIYFIIDDATFFLPSYLDGVLSQSTDEIIGITPLNTSSRHTIYSYIIRNLWRIGIIQIIKIGFEFMEIIVGQILYKLGITRKPFTIHQVANKHNIQIYDYKNVNNDDFVKFLKKKKVDVVISSCSVIFKHKLLSTPKIACINRHSGLLPSYGGLFPIFYGMIKKEKNVGVSVHYMNEGIDKGKVITQEIIKVHKNSTLFGLYKISYQRSIDATIRALDILAKRKKKDKLLRPEESYFSYPNNSDWDIFFKQKRKFI